MLIYNILLTLVGFVFIQKYSIRKYLDTFVLLILIFLATLRGDFVGADTPTYLEYFINAIDLKTYLVDSKEFGYYFLTYLLRLITDNQIVFFLLVSLLTYVPLFVFIKKTSVNVSLSLFLYIVIGYYSQSFNIIRQSIAMSFILLSIYQLQSNSIYKSLLWFFLAIQFHFSAILFGIIYLVKYLKFNFRFVLISILTSLFIGLIITTNPNSLSGIFDIIALFSTLPISKYLYLIYSSLQYKNIFGLLSTTLPLSIVTIIAYKNIQEDLYLKLFFIGVVLSNILSVSEDFERVTYYLVILSIIIYPSLIASISNIKVKIFLYLLIILQTVSFLYSGYMSCAKSLATFTPNSFPYKFFFE